MIRAWRKPLFPKVNMLYLYLVCGCAILVVSLVWYLMNSVTLEVMEIILTAYPDDIDSDVHTFLSNFWAWFLILFTVGLLIYAFVFSQKQRAYGYGYG